jgi:hypothetical protein
METQETYTLRKHNLQETPVPNKISCDKAHLIPGNTKVHTTVWSMGPREQHLHGLGSTRA